jgi:hypothetical protein
MAAQSTLLRTYERRAGADFTSTARKSRESPLVSNFRFHVYIGSCMMYGRWYYSLFGNSNCRLKLPHNVRD